MNKHIELVKKWLADPESVTLEELDANNKNAVSASTSDAAADAAYAAYNAAYTPFAAAYWRNQAIRYVKEYEELTK